MSFVFQHSGKVVYVFVVVEFQQRFNFFAIAQQWRAFLPDTLNCNFFALACKTEKNTAEVWPEKNLRSFETNPQSKLFWK